jgi:hypothetical protein
MQFWVMQTTGPRFEIVSSQINGNGSIDVGVHGDLNAAKAMLNKQFPGFIDVHAANVVEPM